MNLRTFADAIEQDQPVRFSPAGREVRSLQTKRARFALAGAIDALLTGDSEIRDGIQPSVATWLLVLERDLAVIRIDQSGEEASASIELHSLAGWLPKARLVRTDQGSAETPAATEAISLDRLPGFPEHLAESHEVSRESLLVFWHALLAAREAGR